MTRGETRAAPSAGSATRKLPEVDYRAVFERIAAPCLLVLPDAPRYSVVAATDAYLALGHTSRATSVDVPLLEALAQAGLELTETGRETLHATLDRALAQRNVTRLRLDSGEPSSSLGLARPSRPTWAVVNIPVLSSPAEVGYLFVRFDRSDGALPSVVESTRALELELAERTRELGAASAELESFSYAVAHDLRAPLRAIDGFSQALAQDYATVLDADAGEYLQHIRAGAQRMSALLDDMLELSRVLSTPLRKTTLDLSEVARRVIDRLRRSNPERSVSVDIAPQLAVHADSHLTTMLLEKLLGNAWKFTSKKPSASIQFGREPGAGATTLFVADDGAGFDMSSAARLFAPFQRLHKPSDFDGRGMGLAIAHRIVTRHGGRIWADAEVGKGARFRWTVELVG